MKTVRRLYFYAVVLISVEVVLWGLINLLRSITDETIGGAADALAQAMALVLVGVPIFLFHWLWVQRSSAREEEERTASLRAVFFYALLVGTLIPVVQNLLALINRIFIDAVKLDASRAILGGSQTWSDNLIAILMNGVVAAYFWDVLRREWKSLPGKENFADVRRLYRYIWVLYGLSMTVFGAQQTLRFLFYVPSDFTPSDLTGNIGREILVNGIALLVIGTPIWIYSWRIVQDSLNETAEQDSNLRLGILYLLALGGVITVLTTAAIVVDILLRKLLGAELSTTDFIHQLGDAISIGVPLGAIWAYYGHWLNRHIETIADPVRQAGMKRVYFYLLSALGLGGAFIGIASLIKFIIDLTTGGSLTLDDALRSNLTGALSLVAAWLPLWVLTWRPMQASAFAANDAGDHARRSIVRKAYLYLALFAGVIGGMIAAVALVFELLQAVLKGSTESTFVATILNDLQLLVLFVILLVYHLTTLRRDGQFTADTLARKQSEFKVLVADSGDGFGESVKTEIGRLAPGVPVTVASKMPDIEGAMQFNAMVMSGSLAVEAPDWSRSFSGSRIIIPDVTKDLIWAGGVGTQATHQAAQIVRQLAEGQELRKQTGINSGWMLMIYIAAALFGLEILSVIVGLVFAAFIH
jgi:hypothetical protein